MFIGEAPLALIQKTTHGKTLMRGKKEEREKWQGARLNGHGFSREIEVMDRRLQCC